MNPFLENIQNISDLPVWFLALVTTWILIWKGLALWKAAKRNSSIWFVVLLVVNTVGILEILYFYLFSEMKFDSEDKNAKKRKIFRKNLAKQKAFLDK